MFFFFSHTETNAPVAGELHSVGFSLSLFSYNHFIEEPAAASSFAIMSNPHPADLPDGCSLDYKLIQLERLKNSEKHPILMPSYISNRGMCGEDQLTDITTHFLNQWIQYCDFSIYVSSICATDTV